MIKQNGDIVKGYIMAKYELNISMEELEKRTHKDYLTTKKMLEPTSVEYTSLEDGDKKALVHLVKAAYILEKAIRHIQPIAIYKADENHFGQVIQQNLITIPAMAIPHTNARST